MKKLVLFGDSITAGFGDEAVSPILNNLIAKAIAALQLETVQIVNAGIPGDTTLGGINRLEHDVLAENPDLVTIFFGANDMSYSRDIPVELFEENLRKMVTAIGKEKVYLITPPYVDSARKTDRPAARIFEYVEKTRIMAKELDVPLIDLYHAMSVYPESNEFLQEDGLHFSQYGYDLLAALIVRDIKGRLNPKES